MIYSVTCGKDSGECARLGGPQYVGYTKRAAKTRFSEHLGSATQHCQVNTTKPVGVHFRSVGHDHRNMVFLPIEKVRSSDKFVMEAREAFWIRRYEAVKMESVEVIEHGMNIDI